MQAQFFNKCFSAIKKSSRGPPAFNRLFKFFQRFDNLNSLKKEALVKTKKHKLWTTFSGSFFSQFFSKNSWVPVLVK